MSAIPPSIRKILDSGRGEVAHLQRQYHIWVAVTVLAALSGLLLIFVSILLFTIDTTENLLIARLIIGFAAGADFVILYVVYQETMARRRYLLEVQQLMLSGLSFIDSLRRGLRDLFN